MKKERIVYALKMAIWIVGFSTLWDFFIDKDTFYGPNYLKKQIFFFLFLLVGFILFYNYRDITWKEFIAKINRKNK